ncbi:MAG: DUF2085 domain-containing protein [Chloroflexi bacterium]|nr:DUF2085 domain-containing protein [Chloroflexota bacterium]
MYFTDNILPYKRQKSRFLTRFISYIISRLMQSMKKTLPPFLLVLTSVAITLNWLHGTPSGIYQKIFAIGSTVCHQIPSHSFHFGETQFSLCARCAGLYLGSLIGLGYFFTQGKKKALPPRGILILLVSFFLLWAGDGVNSFISDFLNRPFLYETTNLTRLATGFGMGLTMSTALMTLFNVTIWMDSSNTPLLHHPLQVAGYTAASLLLGWLLLSGGQILFSGLAYIAIGIVLLIISMLYTVFWVIMTRKEMQFTEFKSLGFYLIAGFGTAMIQITLLYMLRNWLLG